MKKRFAILFLAFSVAISACGSVKGNAPGRAGANDAVPYDATHLDPGNTTGSAAGVSGSDNATRDPNGMRFIELVGSDEHTPNGSELNPADSGGSGIGDTDGRVHFVP